tara:strand:+ start:57 stop:728 length:672 start_codon:yes stop_codon:yes gene_type:complete
MSDKFVLQQEQKTSDSKSEKSLNFISREHMLFATPFWQTKVEGVDNEPIKKYCYEMRDKKPGVVISNRGGWHSKEILEPIPDELKNFFNQVQTWANNYCAQITGITDLVLGNWWVNINPKYTYNRTHDHQRSILSGVYYVDCEGENIGNLIVERNDNMEFFAGRYQNKSPICLNNFTMLPYTGFLLMFPAWTYHSVEMNMEDRDRISIAFNFVDPQGGMQQYG